ncbi:hypothetical protein [Paenibacillus wenxiniae]|uniref:Uncharacterized protein n=1 Tax=Paenibacillus wenxiniae TaxID=1636843 RepID=A0ABW4RKB6_9BACL
MASIRTFLTQGSMKSNGCEAKYFTAWKGQKSTFIPNWANSRGSAEFASLLLFEVVAASSPLIYRIQPC